MSNHCWTGTIALLGVALVVFLAFTSFPMKSIGRLPGEPSNGTSIIESDSSGWTKYNITVSFFKFFLFFFHDTFFDVVATSGCVDRRKPSMDYSLVDWMRSGADSYLPCFGDYYVVWDIC